MPRIRPTLRRGLPFLTGAAIAAAAACAPVSQAPTVDKAAAESERRKQLELALEQKIADYRRLHEIAYRILAANAELCRPKDAARLNHGLYLVDEATFGDKLKPAARSVLGVGKTPFVVAVASKSSGKTAGFEAGDEIVAVDGWKPPSDDSVKALNERLKDVAKTDRSLAVVVRRKGAERTLDLGFDTTCAYGYALENDDTVNAYADGSKIVFTTGMMRFAGSESDLATVVGHEIGHNLMGHIDKKTGNAIIGTVFDILFAGVGVNTGGTFGNIGAGAFSQEFEAEADYVGLYLMARAGFDIAPSPNLWRKMAIAHPNSIRDSAAASHPSTPERFVALEATVKEIEAKRAAGKPLIPEIASPPPVASPPDNRSAAN